MLEGILGKKIGMSQFFKKNGDCIPVTVIEVGPVTVIQKKTEEKDGYNAVQIGFQEITDSKLKNVTKPIKGHFKEQKTTKFLGEFKAQDFDSVEIGQTFDVSLFKKGHYVDISGTSKGCGFSGVMKRHNFKGGPGAHGHRFNRGTGAIGNSADPAKVWKNKKMSGQFGNRRVTIQALEIVDVKPDLNVLLVKGGIPGPNGRLVEIYKTVKNK